MNYRSVCTGIAAEAVAWHPLGWNALSFSEVDPFCNALLKARFPQVQNYGDFTQIKSYYGDTDILFGGTPCQSFSHAGNRKGLDDARGNLAIEFIRLAVRLRVRWIVWENVAGVLSRDSGGAFGTFIGALGEGGYGIAYRVLDAQYDGLAQRRKRVFVVGHLGDWRPSVAVLFERESLRRDTSPRRTKGKETTEGTGSATYFNCDARLKVDQDVARVLKSDTGSGGRGCVMQAVPILEAGARTGKSTTGIRCGSGIGEDGDPMYTLTASKQHAVAGSAALRRMTPREWERLMGFPDDYTRIEYRGKPAADGPRYKAIGNSVSVPTLRWIGKRIQMVEDISKPQ